MRSAAARSDALETLVAALRSGSFDEAAARQLYTLGPDAVILALLAAAGRIVEQDARLAMQDARLAALEAQVRDTADVVTPATPIRYHLRQRPRRTSRAGPSLGP